MLELALNEEREEGIFQKDIAKNQDVSNKYLDHIISDLKSAGLIINVAGKKSGYRLNKPADEITVYDIYRAFENELAIIDCLLIQGECPKKKHCVIKEFWCDLNQSLRSQMEDMNLGLLANKYKKAEEINTNTNK